MRIVLFGILAAAILSFPDDAFARGAPAAHQDSAFAPKLTIYLAKGEPDSCGPGCDRWIAVEGRIDGAAAGRFRKFLRHVKAKDIPFYFYSPGGDVAQSLAIGRLLRARHATARVGRTIVTVCGKEPQIDSACEKIKNAGGELNATVTTDRAMCNSACGFLFLGATTREVAPNAVIGIHNPKMLIRFRGDPPPRFRIYETAVRRERFDRETDGYIAAMGIDREFTRLVHKTSFDKPHALTRQELYRFGIDKRDVSDSPWEGVQAQARPSIRKWIFVKRSDGAFELVQWRFYCGGTFAHYRFEFISPPDPAIRNISLNVATAAGKELPFRRGQNLKGWLIFGTNFHTATLDRVVEGGLLRVLQKISFQDGKESSDLFQIETVSLKERLPAFDKACETQVRAPSNTVSWPSQVVPAVIAPRQQKAVP